MKVNKESLEENLDRLNLITGNLARKYIKTDRQEINELKDLVEHLTFTFSGLAGNGDVSEWETNPMLEPF